MTKSRGIQGRALKSLTCSDRDVAHDRVCENCYKPGEVEGDIFVAHFVRNFADQTPATHRVGYVLDSHIRR